MNKEQNEITMGWSGEMERKEIKVFAVFYKDNMSFQTITTDFGKWLKEHNELRGAFTDSEVLIEHKHEFEIFEDVIEILIEVKK